MFFKFLGIFFTKIYLISKSGYFGIGIAAPGSCCFIELHEMLAIALGINFKQNYRVLSRYK